MSKLSIVTTLYKSSDFVQEFYERCTAVAKEVSSDYEIIMVNDGSPDNSLEIAKSVADMDDHVIVLDLTRNFGHHTAILAGLNSATGDLIFVVDSDLEEPPEVLAEFLDVMNKEDADVVHGRHRQSEGTALRRYSSKSFWRLYNYLADTKIEHNSCPVRLFTRRYLDSLLQMPERNIFLGGMYHWPGFKQVSVLIDRKLRREVSTYSFSKRFSLFALAILDFSTKPLQLIFLFGLGVSAFSFALGIYFIVWKLVAPQSIAIGFAGIIISIWFVGGIIMSMLGVVGIYIARIYTEVKQRPQFLIREIYRKNRR